MKLLTITALSIATLSLTACATHAPHGVDETPQKLSKVLSGDLLLAGIDADKISADGVSVGSLSSQNPVCQTFNKNAMSFAEVVISQANVVPKPPGGGFGTNLLKTLAFGTLAGAASGGVGSLGISSSFLEFALAGAANQVVYQGSDAAFNAVTSSAGNKGLEGAAEIISPYQKIQAAASQIGCPAPGFSALGLDALPAGGVEAGDHTHSAGEHTHTSSDGTTYTHTH